MIDILSKEEICIFYIVYYIYFIFYIVYYIVLFSVCNQTISDKNREKRHTAILITDESF